MMTSSWQIVTPLPFFQFMVNPEAKFQTHSLILTQLSYYALSRGTTFAKKYYFFQTNKDISTIMGVLVLKGIFSETTCVCMCVSTDQSSNS